MSLTPISSWIKPLNEAFTISAGNTQSFSAQDLVGDDEGVNGSVIRLESVGNAAHGTVQLVDGQYIYTPTAGFVGDDRFSYIVTDQFGNHCTETVEVHVTAAPPVTPAAVLPPVITDVIDDAGASTGKVSSGGSTDDTLPTLKGTGEPGSTITIYDNGTRIGTAVTGADWQWTFTPAQALPAGAHAFTATGSHTDGSGATPGVYAYSVTIGADGPAASVVAVLPPVITDITDNAGAVTGRVADGATTDDMLPTLKGTGEPGSTITIYDNGVRIGTAVTGADWLWTFTPAQALPAGVHAFTAAGSHADGSGATPGVYAYTVNLGDSVVLIGPQVEITEDRNNDGSLTGTELQGGLDIKVTLPATARVGDTLELSDQAGHKVERLLTEADITAGVLNFTDAFPVPAQGQTFTVTGVLTDAAGNCSPMTSDSAVISTTPTPAPRAPTVVITTDDNNDGTISQAELDAHQAIDVKVDLPVDARAGDTLTVVDQAGRKVEKVLTADDIAAKAVTLDNAFPAPADGQQVKVTATVSDMAGNVSPEATDQATYDGNVAPVSVNDTNAVKGYVAGAAQQQGVTATGNVLTNDTDADGPATALKVAGVSSSAATLQAGTGVESVLEGRYGHLTVHADGSYTYVSDKSAGLTGAVDDVFYYLNKDANGAVSGDPAKLTIHVEPPFAQVLSVSSPTVVEGGSLDFTVTTSSAGSATPITLALQSGTATVGTDTGNPVQVNFGQGWVTVVGNVVNAPAGTTSFQVRVPTTQDTLVERTEQFSLTASTATGSQASGMGAITDNDLGGTARGTEDKPLTLTADNFHISAGQKLVIDTLPADGKLQYNNGGTWTAVTAGQEVSKADIDAGRLRFVPDANESGTDAYNAPGVGNQKSDYAHAGYSLVDTASGDRLSGGTLAIDITPVADLGTLGVTMSGIKVQVGPAGLAKSYANGNWWQYKFALSGASPDQDGSESQWVAISKMVNVNGGRPKLFHADGTQVLPDATGLLWVKASETVYVDNPGYSTTITYQIGERELNSAGQVLHQVLGGTKTVSMVSPLVLDLDGDGVQTTDMAHGTHFDLLGNGHATETGWVSRQDGLLALDVNGNGRIDSGAELFGEGTRLADGSRAQDGFQALGALDTNHDGKITSTDAAFAQLEVWQDANSDGVTQNGELHDLAALGISALSLDAVASDAINNGNSLGLLGSYTTTDGVTHQMADVWFASADPAGTHAGLDAQGPSLDQLLANAGLPEARPAAPAARPDAAAHDTRHSAPAAPVDLPAQSHHDWAH